VDEKNIKDTKVIDELLMRNDKNPNSKGLLKVSAAHGLEKQNLAAFQKELETQKIKTLVVFSPADPDSDPEFMNSLKGIEAVETKIQLGTAAQYETLDFDCILPTLSFVEKAGTFINFNDVEQKIEAGAKLVEDAKAISEILC